MLDTPVYPEFLNVTSAQVTTNLFASLEARQARQGLDHNEWLNSSLDENAELAHQVRLRTTAGLEEDLLSKPRYDTEGIAQKQVEARVGLANRPKRTGRVASGPRAPKQGLRRLDTVKSRFKTAIYREKPLIRRSTGALQGYQGLYTRNIYDGSGNVMEAGKAVREDRRRQLDNVYESPTFFDNSHVSFRTLIAYNKGCELLPQEVDMFRMKRNSEVVESVVSDNSIPRHVRQFLERNRTSVDGTTVIPSPWQDRPGRSSQQGIQKKSVAVLYAIMNSALQKRDWFQARRAFSLLIRNPDVMIQDIWTYGLEIIARTERSSEGCVAFLDHLIIDLPYLPNKKNYERRMFFSKPVGAEQFFRELAVVYLRLDQTEQLVDRLDEVMIAPPYSLDPILKYLRGAALVRQAYQIAEGDHNRSQEEAAKIKIKLALADLAAAARDGVQFPFEEMKREFANLYGNFKKKEVPEVVCRQESLLNLTDVPRLDPLWWKTKLEADNGEIKDVPGTSDYYSDTLMSEDTYPEVHSSVENFPTVKSPGEEYQSADSRASSPHIKSPEIQPSSIDTRLARSPVKMETQPYEEDDENTPWWMSLHSDSKEPSSELSRQSDASEETLSDRSDGDNAAPWWETLHSDGADEVDEADEADKTIDGSVQIKTLSNENSFIDGFNDLALPEAQNGDGEDSDLDELLYGESGRKKKKSRKPKEEDVNVDDFFV